MPSTQMKPDKSPLASPQVSMPLEQQFRLGPLLLFTVLAIAVVVAAYLWL